MSDEFAGRRVACKACGTTFRVPGTMPEMVFFPAGDPPPGPLTIVTDTAIRPPSRRRRWEGSPSDWLAVATAAAIVASLLWCSWSGGTASDFRLAGDRVVAFSMFAAAIIVPVEQARKGRLSPGRWCALAGSFAVAFLASAAFVDHMKRAGDASSRDVGAVAVWAVTCGIAVGGCFLAAALHRSR